MTIPFEFQRSQPGERRCGAAALVMVYRNFGLIVDQDTVWQEIRRYSEKLPNNTGLRTFHLARNALEHRLAAIPCRFVKPWESLKTCSENAAENAICVILNHRIRSDSASGHFSVLVGMNTVKGSNERVRLHDPQFGPDSIVEKAELLKLWQPFGTDCEITGNIAVLITAKREDDETCSQCGNRFTMKPFRHLEFQTVFCPWCDTVNKF